MNVLTGSILLEQVQTQGRPDLQDSFSVNGEKGNSVSVNAYSVAKASRFSERFSYAALGLSHSFLLHCLKMWKDFIRAFYSSWGSGVTGTASAPLFVIAFMTNGVPRYISAAFAIVFLFVASYMVMSQKKGVV